MRTFNEEFHQNVGNFTSHDHIHKINYGFFGSGSDRFLADGKTKHFVN